MKIRNYLRERAKVLPAPITRNRFLAESEDEFLFLVRLFHPDERGNRSTGWMIALDLDKRRNSQSLSANAKLVLA